MTDCAVGCRVSVRSGLPRKSGHIRYPFFGEVCPWLAISAAASRRSSRGRRCGWSARAGGPWPRWPENCYIESFNGKLRDECLRQHHFATLEEARTRIETWRAEYNTERPHRGLGQLTPAEYAARFTPEEGPSSQTILRF